MASSAVLMPTADVYAHPVSGHPHVDIPLTLTAGAAAVLVFAVSLAVPGRSRSERRSEVPFSSWSGHLSRGQLLTRAVGVALLALVVASGRIGVDDELENLAPALAVGLAVPLLVVAGVALGPVWRWVDPWDSLSRAVSSTDQGEPPAHVWPAVAVALPLLWYLSAYPDVLSPRAVGLVLALYTVVTVAGCIAVGRARWLATAEPIGIILSWIALLPRGRLADWSPPRGAEALLGVVAGGTLFGLVRRAEVWSGLSAVPGALTYASVGLAVSCTVFAGLLLLIGRVADLVGDSAGVARSAVPAVAAVVVAVALDRNRLFTSAQLLPGLLGDPFGRGWDLLGSSLAGLDPEPLGAAGLLALQIGVLVAGHSAGAVVAGLRLLDRTRRVPAGIALLYLAAASVVAVGMH